MGVMIPMKRERMLTIRVTDDEHAHKLCFEITETAAVENLPQALILMERLHQHGCKFALDDFGSGLSSFAYLRSFPVDFLKIDGVFVRNIDKDPINYSIVASITEIGHTTGKGIIAEYVEDESIVTCLEKIGVDFVQGYAIERPKEFVAKNTRARR